MMMMTSLVSVTELDHRQVERGYKLIILENLIEAFHVQ